MADQVPVHSRPKLGSLTGIRFPFAILVILNHVVILYVVGAERPNKDHPQFQAWCQWGANLVNSSWVIQALTVGAAVGLSLFFTLSGFILTYNYQGSVEPTPINKRDFWVARIARVYPLYLLALLVSTPLFLLYVSNLDPPYPLAKTILMSISAVFLLQSWWPEASTLWNPPGWSLSCEAFFYVLFPFMIPLFNGWSMKKLLWMVPICWIAMLVPAVTYHAIDPDNLGGAIWRSEGFWFNFIKHNPLLRIPEFIAGIAMGRMYALKTANPHDTSWRGSGAWMSCGGFAAIIGVMLISPSLPYIVLHNGLILPLFFVMIWGLALEGGPLDWILSRKLLVLFGDATFSMYLMHTSMIAFGVGDLIAKKHYDQSPWSFLFWVTVLTIGLSILNFKTFEIPWQRRVRKWLSPKKETAVVAPVAPPVET